MATVVTVRIFYTIPGDINIVASSNIGNKARSGSLNPVDITALHTSLPPELENIDL
jgi:hypothetical protein